MKIAKKTGDDLLEKIEDEENSKLGVEALRHFEIIRENISIIFAGGIGLWCFPFDMLQAISDTLL